MDQYEKEIKAKDYNKVMHPEIIIAKQNLQKSRPMIVHEDIASNKSSGAMPEEEYKPRVVNSNIDADLL
jgi:hypothetical protein